MRGIAGAALVLVLTVGAGCTDEPRPRFEEPTATPSAPDSSSAAAVEKEPWEKRSRSGAVAFARHWVDVFNASMQSGETQEMRSLSRPSCTSCRGYAQQIDDLYADGGRLEGNGWVVKVASLPPGQVAREVEVSLRITRTPQRVTLGNGKVKRYPQTQATYAAALGWRDQQWIVRSLEVFG